MELALPGDWLDRLTTPELEDVPIEDPAGFVGRHRALLETRLQETLASTHTPDAQREACCLMMALSLHLGRSNGMSPVDGAQRWIEVAKQHGAG